MEVEIVKSLANQMQRFAESLTEKHQNVNSIVRNIDWNGDSRQQFSSEANSMIGSLDKLADSVLISSRSLDKEIDQWVTADYNGSKNIQAAAPPNDPSGFQKFIGNFWLISTWIAGKIDSPELNRVWDYLGKTSTGKDLERLACENNVCFILPDGTRIGDPNAVMQIPVKFGKLETGDGVYSFDTRTITISDDIPLGDGLVGLSGILAHEMQHAIDHASGEFLPSPPLEGQSEAQLEESLAKYFDAYIHSEVRAYERSENITEFTSFFDDGVLTGSERIAILNHKLNSGTYRSMYENSIIDAFKDGRYTADISVDSNSGELVVDLQPIAQPLSEFAYTA
jgi:hypothetical protein